MMSLFLFIFTEFVTSPIPLYICSWQQAYIRDKFAWNHVVASSARPSLDNSPRETSATEENVATNQAFVTQNDVM